jgi:aromatic ring-opening dioxygenase catalytic subunit (LigB family)
MLVHNLAAPRTPVADSGYARDVEKAALDSLDLPAEERKLGLLALQKRKDWKLAHPTDDHILPLYVALGAGLDAKEYKVWSQGLYGVGFSMVSFRLGTVV